MANFEKYNLFLCVEIIIIAPPISQNYMKQLVLLRHGKAEQGTMTKDDYDRLLTEYGKKNVSDMGDFILTKWGSPDQIGRASCRERV